MSEWKIETKKMLLPVNVYKGSYNYCIYFEYEPYVTQKTHNEIVKNLKILQEVYSIKYFYHNVRTSSYPNRQESAYESVSYYIEKLIDPLQFKLIVGYIPTKIIEIQES